MSIVKPKTALISLSDKTNIKTIVEFLEEKKIKILSTGGTYKAIKEITKNVIEVSEFTGFEEMMDGRVKTLHPKIHAGILARRDSDMSVLKEKGYEPIDLVIVNLYPFEETIKKDCSFEEAIEQIDIGGPTMIRAAAKNFKDVVVVTDPNDYKNIINEWNEKDGISYESRKSLSKKVFSTMANYNKSIYSYLNVAEQPWWELGHLNSSWLSNLLNSLCIFPGVDDSSFLHPLVLASSPSSYPLPLQIIF